MISRKLFWHLYFSFLLIVLISLAIVSVFTFAAIKYFFLKTVEDNLYVQGVFIEQLLSDDILEGRYSAVDKYFKKTADKTQTRVTFMLATGKVVADSVANPEDMDNQSDMPEVISAWQSGLGVETRYNSVSNKNMMYVALPVMKNNEVMAIVRTGTDIGRLDNTTKLIFYRTGQIGFVIVIAVAAISYIISRKISKPIEKMKVGAERFSRGDFETAIQVSAAEEIEVLAGSLNKMAGQLNERFDTIAGQRNELEAVLSSMAEGVIAVNSEGKIISFNKAARDLLSVESDDVEKKGIEEVVLDSKMQKFVSDALKSDEAISMEITAGEKRDRFLNVYGRKLEYSSHSEPGAIIVFNDFTKIVQLENVRRDFVANVSHELKTPITSIKGFVETLLDGGVESKEDVERFLGIIARHTDRLNAIIEDLLILCRIQDAGENERISIEKANIRHCIAAAVETCVLKAREKDIKIDIQSEDIECQIDPFLIEQALVNLIDNAIKYSEREKSIEIFTEKVDSQLKITVKDHGFGIAKGHLERIFERFYVTDKARTRQLGGTGLGLSIVKHICQAHGGKVEVASVPGKGSEFKIFLPL